jgi:hypothetical protein
MSAELWAQPWEALWVAMLALPRVILWEKLWDLTLEASSESP